MTEKYSIVYISVQFSLSVMSESLWPHGLQHRKHGLPCLSPAPRAYTRTTYIPRERLDFLVFLPSGMRFLLEKMQSPWRLKFAVLHYDKLPDASFKVQVLCILRPRFNELWVNNIQNFCEMLWYVHFKDFVCFYFFRLESFILFLNYARCFWFEHHTKESLWESI